MNIVFVTYHTCARADKMARALIAAGHQVIVLQHLAASENILYGQQLSSFYYDQVDLAAKVKMLNIWANVFHVHNEPNWPVSITCEAADARIPVIYDCHDLNSMRTGTAGYGETEAFKRVDAAIFPSIAYLQGATKYHDFHEPSELVYSMCLKDDRPTIQMPRIDALVYEGHHIAPLDHFAPSNPLYYGYRDYINFSRECSTRNIPLAMYGTRKEFAPSYRLTGALVTGMLPFPEMMKEMTRYRWGFIGHPDNHPQWQKAMPNKMFEYLTAGIPVIAWNCAEAEMWLEGYDIGVVVKSYEELDIVFKDTKLRRRKAKKVAMIRDAGHFDMEIQVPKIIKLYERALANNPKVARCTTGRTAQ